MSDAGAADRHGSGAEPGAPVEAGDDELLAAGANWEGVMVPGDGPQAVEDWGTTAAEERAGESLGARLSREVPEPEWAGGGDEQVTQLYDTGDPFGPDDEATVVAGDAALPAEGASAEEAAVHVVDEPPGVTYDDGPGYLD